MNKHFILFVILLIFGKNIDAQYSVKVGNENSGSIEYQPCNNQYDYSWSATVYKQNDINSHGTITDIFYKSYLQGGFGPGSNTYMLNQRIFMKLVTDDAMTSNAFPDTNSMTLVYAGTVEFLAYQLATIHLDTPFDLDDTHNLMILYVNKSGYKQTNSDYFLYYPTEHNQTSNNTVYNVGNGSFPSGNGTYTDNMPVVYLKYSSGIDVGVSAINQRDTFMLPQQADLTCQFRNYMADTITSTDIEWELNGIPQTTYNWTGTSYCGQETAPFILQNNFDFAPGQYSIKAYTKNPNFTTDELNTNDTMDFTIRVSDSKEFVFGNYTDNRIPFLSNWYYGWSSSIYNKDYIDFSGTIKAIAYYVTNANGGVEPHQKIFMRTTPNLTNTSTDYPDTSLFTKVFEGTIDYSSTGWHFIELDTVFYYDNTENLMILYENHSGIGTTQATGFKVIWMQTNAIYNYDLNSFPTNSGSVLTGSRVPALKLFFVIPKDAGVTKLTNSDIPVFTGNNNFIVDFKNYGLDTLQDVDLKFQINNGAISSYHWNGNVSPLDEITNLNIGTGNLSYGNHDIKIWTENPNFLPDYVNRNDTLKISLRACSPLSGNYVIGPAPSDFLTVSAAIDSLNNCGVNGAVTFNIKSGTYIGQYMLNEVLGASEINTITFQSQTGDSTDVVLTTDSTDYIIYLNGADHISFKHLTFESDSAINYVVMDSVCEKIVFSNNLFYSDTTVSTYIYSSSDFKNENITIQNNYFINGEIAIDIDNAGDTSLTVVSNNIFETNNTSIKIYNDNNLTITNNIISDNTNEAIYINMCDNTNIFGNKINSQNLVIGIHIYKCFSVTVANNFISGDFGGFYNSGIYAIGYYSNTEKYKVVYNTINIQSGQCNFYGYQIDSLWLYNNIFVNETDEVIRLFSTAFESDNNCFHTKGNVLASYNGSANVSSLNDWVTQTQNDSNSIFVLPYFFSPSDLHTNSYLVDNKGVYLDFINADIDGDTRDPSTPDIGADEFTTTCTGVLSGTYIVGVNGDFLTINEAVQALYDCGVSDDVWFVIEPGTYNEQVEINGEYINYLNGIKPVSFQPNGGNNTAVIITYDSDSLNNYLLKLKNVNSVSIFSLTFQPLDTLYGRAIVLEGENKSVNIFDSRFYGVPTANDDNQNAIIYAKNITSNADTMTVNVKNNYFFDGSSGIYFKDYSYFYYEIDRNNFDNQKFSSIYIGNNPEYNTNNLNTAIITNNVVTNTNNPVYGILCQYIDSSYIAYNKLSISTNRSCTGIANYSVGNLVFNNFVSIKSLNNIPIHSFYTTWDANIYNNTFYLYGQGHYFSATCDFGQIATLFNNNLVNLVGNRIIYSYYGYSNITSDYNNFYSTSSYFDFEDWQNTTGLDSHSVSFMPNFVSNTDLHTNAALLYQKGVALPEVTNDIDGDIRNNPPCIGADEFTLPEFYAGNDTVYCFYDANNFNVNSYIYDIGYGYDSYQWSNGSDSSSILIDTANVAVGQNTFFVTVTIGANTYTDTVNIFYDKPEPISQTEYCYWNTPIVITANPGFESYLWENGDTTQAITVNTYQGMDLIVTDNYGCSAKNSIHITTAQIYTPLSEADFGIEDTSICNNQILQLNANQYQDSTDVYDYFSFLWNTGDTTQSILVDSTSYGIGNHSFITTVYLVQNPLCSSSDTVNVEITDCSGIETYNNFDIVIYPNPAHNKIILEGEKPSNYVLMTITGKVLKQFIIRKMPETIDISGLPSGIYLLKLQFGNTCTVKKIIIN